MPACERQRIKRRFDQVVKHLATGQKYIIEEAMQFKETHPDLYQKLCDIVTAIDVTISSVENFRDEI